MATRAHRLSVRRGTAAPRPPARTLTPGELAWIAAVPCALAAVLAIVLLGRPLGAALFASDATRFWPAELRVRPEPTEHARYVLAVLAPVVLVGVVAALNRRSLRGGVATAATIRIAGALTLGFAAFAPIAAHWLTYRGIYAAYPAHRVYFSGATLAVAAAIAAGLVLALRDPALVGRAGAAVRETPRRHLVALAIVLAVTAAWLLTAFNTEGTIGLTSPEEMDNIPFWLDETFAILNGSVPLVSFHEVYGQLWTYVPAAVMALLGASFGVFAATMVAASGATLLAVYAIFRRVAHSSLLALALFVPFVATSFFREEGSLANRYGPSNLFSLFPVRYGGAYLLAWLTARQLEQARSRRLPLLFLVAGLVAIDNVEFGVPALLATLAALLCGMPGPLRRTAARLAGSAAAGALGAVVLVTALTLAVGGALPRFGLVLEFSGIFAAGFNMLPMPPVGVHLALYLTFAAAAVVGAVRALSGEPDRVLTGMLCWAGVFGFGAGAYYVGRSHPDVLIGVFSAWAFALALLTVVVVRALARGPARWPTAAELCVLLGFGVMVCSLAQTPTPWSQLSRLRQATATPAFRYPAVERLVRGATRRGQTVAILAPNGHRIAYDLGLVNVSPYSSVRFMPEKAQWAEALRTFRARNVHALFLPLQDLLPEEVATVRRAGWRLVGVDRGVGVARFVR